MLTLIIFPTPLSASCTLQPDGGPVLAGTSVVHPTGRDGVGFLIPDDTPNGHGSTLNITAPGKVPISQRGILWLNTPGFAYPWTPGQEAAFAADDFRMTSANIVLPRLVPVGEFLMQDLG